MAGFHHLTHGPLYQGQDAASLRLRKRAVTGSSAVERRLSARSGAASVVWPALSALIRSASSATEIASTQGSPAAPESPPLPAGCGAARPALSWSRRSVGSDRPSGRRS